jgi:hypothetical protein
MIQCLNNLEEQKLDIDARMEKHCEDIAPQLHLSNIWDNRQPGEKYRPGPLKLWEI